MVNTVAVGAMVAQLEHAVALGLAIVGGYAAGRPVKRSIIRKWAKR